MADDFSEGAEGKENIVVRISVRMDPEVHRRLRKYANKLNEDLPYRDRISIDSLIQQAVEQWLSGSTPKSPSMEGSHIPTKEPKQIVTTSTQIASESKSYDSVLRNYLEMADRVLRHPKPGLAEALKSNLGQFEDAAKLWERVEGRRHAAGGEFSEPIPAETVERLVDEIGRGREEVERASQKTEERKGRPSKKAG